MGQIKTVSLVKASSGDLTVFDATGTQVVKLLGYVLSAPADATVEWKSGSTSLSGAMTVAAKATLAVPMTDRDRPHLQCAAGADLILTVSAAVTGHATIDVE